jgi:hypothetical protein
MPNVLSDVGLGVEPLWTVITLIFVGRHFVGLHHVGPQLGCWYFLRIFSCLKIMSYSNKYHSLGMVQILKTKTVKNYVHILRQKIINDGSKLMNSASHKLRKGI